MKRTYTVGRLALVGAAVLALGGCAAGWQAAKMQTEAKKSIAAARAQEPAPPPVVVSSPGAFLLGEAVKVAPPLSPILTSSIVYHPAQRVSLADVAAYITLEKGLVVDVSEVRAATQATQGAQQPGATPPTLPVSGAPGGLPVVLPSPRDVGLGAATASAQAMDSMSINYSGNVAGLLDVAANKAGVWWRFADGKVAFYKTETKTFYLPANARKSTGSSTITTNSGGSTTSASNNAASSGSSPVSGAAATSDYTVDVWGDIEKTAKAVASGGLVVANASVGSLTVTGTPAQVRAVEEWVKTLQEQLMQQVAVTVQIYRVKVTNEDTYKWDPTIVFKKTAEDCGFCLTSNTSLVPASGASPVSMVLSVLPTTGGALGKLSGSQAAFQALSTLGNATEVMRQTVITLNGQPAPIQIANQKSYLAQSSTTQTVNVGATTSLTPGSITVGFTGTFLPRVVGGKIILNMALTNSSSNGFSTVGTADNFIQTTDVDLNSSQQSVALAPGDALLLNSLESDKSKTNNSGVGLAQMPLLGGGVNAGTDKTMIAVVITAKVL